MESPETTFCFRCHYDLRGVADDQPCPECGLLAGRSRRATDALRDARPKWLRSLAIGVWLILIAIGLSLEWATTGQESLQYYLMEHDRFLDFLHTNWGWPLYRFVISSIGYDMAALLLLAGAWYVTRPEGYPPADRRDRRRRWLIRLAAIMPIVSIAVMARNAAADPYRYYAQRLTSGDLVVMAMITLGCAPLLALLFTQFRNLAARAGSRHLQEHCLIVGIGAFSTLVIGFAVYLLTNYAEELGLPEQWTSRSLTVLVIILIPATAGVLFWLWSFYLMIRFAISFGRASGESRRAWRAADRSQPAA